MAEIFKAILMGIVEGITEWLPISSTGHMLLLEQLIRFKLSADFLSMFRVVIQLGAIMAVVVLFWNRLWPFKKRDTRRRGIGAYIKWDIFELWLKIAVASLPAAVIGLLLDDWMDAHLYNSIVVAMMLILYGVLFLVIERPGRRARFTRMQEITFRHALIIGCWQVLALIPGTSRSGATIVGGLLIGLSRPLAAQFTFYLAIPVMAGASGLKMVKYLLGGGNFSFLEFAVLVVGMAVSFVVSLVVIRRLMDYVRRHTFRVFGWYRIFLGILVLAVAFWQLVL